MLEAVEKFPVVIYSNSTDPNSESAKTAIAKAGKYIDVFDGPVVYELDLIPNGDEIHKALQKETGAMTTPYVFIDTKFVGGSVKTTELEESGDLKKLLMKTFDWHLLSHKKF